MKSDPCSKQL